MKKIRVGLAGATGKTGSVIAAGIKNDPELVLVGALGKRHAGSDLGEVLWSQRADIPIYGEIGKLLDERRPDVLVDFTRPDVVMENCRAALRKGVRPVIGTTGISEESLKEIENLCSEKGIGAVVIPNFSLGAMLLGKFCEEAAQLFHSAEIVELHHKSKVDAPSGTARSLSKRIEYVTGQAVPIHSVRLPGLVAHHKVVFGSNGEVLILEHHSITRESFVPGVILAIKRVVQLSYVVYRLEDLL